MTRISLQTINHVSEKWHWKGSMGLMFRLLQEIEDLILPYKRHQPEVILCTVCTYKGRGNPSYTRVPIGRQHFPILSINSYRFLCRNLNFPYKCAIFYAWKLVLEFSQIIATRRLNNKHPECIIWFLLINL